jgi:NAD(P)-dependent dehydrogenase (short-subunit alcohol dehydrogenase family)
MSNYLIITGGSRGIGEKTILRFKQQGWNVVNISRTSCTISDVINVNIDLSNNKQIEECAASLLETLRDAKKICLVHNAAFHKRDSIDSLQVDDLYRTLQINVVAATTLNKILIPVMKPTSSIIYIGSTLSVKAVPDSASYVISKHAVIGMMKATCQDLRNKRIYTCCVCPGLVDTALLRETMDEEHLNHLIENVVIGKRLIIPEEIANVIYFCSTSEVINGAILQANLGQVAD